VESSSFKQFMRAESEQQASNSVCIAIIRSVNNA